MKNSDSLEKNFLFKFNSNQNYDRVITDMYEECNKICIKNFQNKNLSEEELSCITNCNFKYYNAFAKGYYIFETKINEMIKNNFNK